jgi:hypothetical protein
MKQKYVFAYNGIWNFFRGVVPLPEAKSLLVYPVQHPGKTFVWRNKVTEGYKVGLSY